MKKTFVFVMLIFVLSTGLVLPKDEIPSHNAAIETNSSVPALNQFHEVIYPIWHNYYPNKDFEGLKKVVPDIDRLARNIYCATLPGILRDKKKAWDEAVVNLKSVIAEYKEAASKNENEKLLVAAEKLHAQYEKMVRMIRPSLKELDAFHVVLYNIYHKDLPDFKLEDLRKNVSILAGKKDELMKAVIPKPRKESPQYESKVIAFENARKDLSQSVDDLVITVKTGDREKIKTAIEKVHTSYQNTIKIFE